MINFLNEFIYFDGKRNPIRDNVKSASNSTTDPMFDPEDGHQLKNATAQQRQQGYRGYYSLVPMPAVKTPIASDSYPTMVSYMDDEEEVRATGNRKNKKYPTPKNIKRKIKEDTTKNKIDGMVEDMVVKSLTKDIFNTKKGEIPSIDIVAEENPILVRKLKNLIDIISLNQATGEQKGIILNFLLSNVDMGNIPSEYKELLKKKIQ